LPGRIGVTRARRRWSVRRARCRAALPVDGFRGRVSTARDLRRQRPARSFHAGCRYDGAESSLLDRHRVALRAGLFFDKARLLGATWRLLSSDSSADNVAQRRQSQCVAFTVGECLRNSFGTTERKASSEAIRLGNSGAELAPGARRLMLARSPGT
jgi:hypothetical protein